MKKTSNRVIVLILSLFIIKLISSSLEKEVQTISETFDYILGQRMILEKIIETNPDLKLMHYLQNINLRQVLEKQKKTLKEN
ncbi:MAG: hypothetical protein K9N06_11335 [Candidatus Cloacimonetes bacterium]|nr:hypothetical protein [Candidatus Cloacimonadota bacterium]